MLGLGARGHGHGVLPRPRLRRPLQSRRHHRLRHMRKVPVEAGASLRFSSGFGIDHLDRDAEVAVRREAWPVPGNGSRRLRPPVPGSRVHHLQNLMFVISGVATDSRAIGELAGLVVGATVVVNVLFAGPISGASMNPARSLGPAIIANRWEGLWVYIVGPICGTVLGAWAYNLIRFTDRPLLEITNTATASFLKRLTRKDSA
ncbi:unnamed protein product [Musa acuminata subsp. malaccensis]|uniref:(wild Malaysian banana) hypothetical protein n=1 Tax=Musa acuminata subsp. malaccensis TaxID=214687 RepID=A0A8D7ARN3_MUSAM|nr:unnamed protein product [Musa acuminata subsp. malaccensis]